jgi:hypothetical protein
MQQKNPEIEINIIPFKNLEGGVEVFISPEEKPNFRRIFGQSIPTIALNAFGQREVAFWSTQGEPSAERFVVALDNEQRFAKHYFNWLIFQHFKNSGAITNRNFIADTEIWIELPTQQYDPTRVFNKFAIKVVLQRFSEGLGLLLSYEGTSHVTRKPITELQGLELGTLVKVLYKNEICKYSKLPEEDRQKTNIIYPVLNRKIESQVNITVEKPRIANKYSLYRKKIEEFYQSHLSGKQIEGRIQITASGFLKLNPNLIKNTSDDGNLLVFGNNNTNFNTYNGLKQFGPTFVPNTGKIEFLFIFHADDREVANSFFSYLKKGFKGFPGIEPFVGIPLNLDKSPYQKEDCSLI